MTTTAATTTPTRQVLFDEAQIKATAARRANVQGDSALAKQFWTQAADRYRAGRFLGLARFADRMADRS